MALSLEDIKARMTEEQRRDMAEIVMNEVKRREAMKQGTKGYGPRPAQKSNVRSSRMSNTLPNEALGEMYSDLEGKVAAIRTKQMDEKLAGARALAKKVGTPRRSVPKARLMSSTSLLVVGVLALGLLKIGFSAGIFGAETRPQTPADEPAPPAAIEAPAPESPAAEAGVVVPAVSFDRTPGAWTEAEKQVLTELDARRVELEKRRQELDQREAQIKNQQQALSERTAELRTLVTKVSQVRKEKDNQYEARLDQLANVYSSMAPNEAAPLVAKLDEDTALELLKRMPGKRMGQILSMMDPERAVRLTKLLSEKASLNEIPAR